MALDLGELVGYLRMDDSDFTGTLDRVPGEVDKAAAKGSAAAGSAGSSISGAFSDGVRLQEVGKKFQDVGGQISAVGGKLTKGITTPALIAGGAVGGMVAAFGWGRLSNVDTAQSQLKGLGYSAEDVERISGNLATALEGGMMTMAEATFAAANGMAAGVEEGKELTRYIQLMDSAVVAGTGSFDEMNKIFSNTADLGHLTATNFDMMTERLPGFSSKMQEHMGVGAEALREMLNNGEVSFDDFMSIIEGGYGDMAKEYALSWEGMVQNTQAYVGIIGQALLGGVFEQSKESIGEFLEFLSSEEVQAWAAETGEAIGVWFGGVVENIRGAIDWFMQLESSQQKAIGAAAGFAVALGPILSVLGGVISAVGGGLVAFGKFSAFMTGGSAAATALGGALKFLLGPWGLLLGVIAAAVAMSPELQAALGEIASTLGGALMTVLEALLPLFDVLADVIGTVAGVAADLLLTLVDAAMPLIDVVVVLVEALAPLAELFGVLVGAILPPLVELLAAILTPILELAAPLVELLAPALEWVATVIGWVVEAITWLLEAVVEWLSSDEAWAESVAAWIQGGQQLADFLAAVVEGFRVGWEQIVAGLQWVGDAFAQGWEQIIAAFQWVGTAFADGWNQIVTFFQSIPGWLAEVFVAAGTWLNQAGVNIINGLRSTVVSGWNSFMGWLRGIPGWITGIFAAAGSWLVSAGTRVITGLRSGVTNMWSSFIGWLRSLPSTIMGVFSGAASWLWSAGQNIVQGLLNGVRSLAGTIGNFFLDLLPGWIVGPFKAALGIASPSKLFAEYGRNLVQGVVVGVNAEEPALDARMRSLVDLPPEQSIGVTAGRMAGMATDADERVEALVREFTDRLDELTDAVRSARPIEVHSNDPEEVAVVVGEHLR